MRAGDAHLLRRGSNPFPVAMREQRETPLYQVTALIALFAVLCVPLGAYLWTTLNDLLSGHARVRELLISAPVLVVFVLVLLLWARVVRRIEAAREDAPRPT